MEKWWLGLGNLALLREDEKPVERSVKVDVGVRWVAVVMRSREDCHSEHEWRKAGFLLRPGLSQV